jgi:hypothetical protein
LISLGFMFSLRECRDHFLPFHVLVEFNHRSWANPGKTPAEVVHSAPNCSVIASSEIESPQLPAWIALPSLLVAWLWWAFIYRSHQNQIWSPCQYYQRIHLRYPNGSSIWYLSPKCTFSNF